MQDYEIVIFTKNDYENYHKVVNLNNGVPVPLETQMRRKWWCFDNPNGGVFAAALAGDKVAATCYLSGKSLLLNGSSYKAYEIGETATEPAHQRKGLFSKLVKACTKYAFDNGAVAVYGTPNSQSTPGYKKMGFTIIEDMRSHLFVTPNIFGFMASKTEQSLIGNQCSKYLKNESYQISSSIFFNATKQRIRLNDFTEKYFEWRFNGLSSDRYKFFQRGNFLMAVREANLGRYKILMVSDFGYLNTRPSTFDAVKEIRKIYVHEFFDWDFSGIYFNSEWDPNVNFIHYGLKRLIQHRQLPICIMTNGNPRVIDEFRSVALPQLSDCDIG